MRWGCQRNNQRSPKTLLFVFRRFACRPAALLSVWGGQPEREASLFNLKFLAARVRVYVRQLADGRVFAAVCGQPVFEVGVVGADEDGGVFLVKIDFGGLSCLVSPVLIGLSFLRLCHAIGVFFGDFLRLLTWEKWRFSNRSAPDDVCPLSDALPFDKMRFFRLYTGISELRPS